MATHHWLEPPWGGGGVVRVRGPHGLSVVRFVLLHFSVCLHQQELMRVYEMSLSSTILVFIQLLSVLFISIRGCLMVSKPAFLGYFPSWNLNMSQTRL